jgi:hypothetical protein
MSPGGFIDMAHACGCRHGSSVGINRCCGAGLTLAAAAASVGMPVATVLAALSAGRKAPA